MKVTTIVTKADLLVELRSAYSNRSVKDSLTRLGPDVMKAVLAAITILQDERIEISADIAEQPKTPRAKRSDAGKPRKQEQDLAPKGEVVPSPINAEDDHGMPATDYPAQPYGGTVMNAGDDR